MAQLSSSDEEAVRSVMNEFPDAWNRHDMDAIGALFAEDADFVNVTGTYWKGRESIRLNHAFTHGAVRIDSAGVTVPKGIYGIFKTSTLHFKRSMCASCGKTSQWLTFKRKCSATLARRTRDEPLLS